MCLSAWKDADMEGGGDAASLDKLGPEASILKALALDMRTVWELPGGGTPLLWKDSAYELKVIRWKFFLHWFFRCLAVILFQAVFVPAAPVIPILLAYVSLTLAGPARWQELILSSGRLWLVDNFPWEHTCRHLPNKWARLVDSVPCPVRVDCALVKSISWSNGVCVLRNRIINTYVTLFGALKTMKPGSWLRMTAVLCWGHQERRELREEAKASFLAELVCRVERSSNAEAYSASCSSRQPKCLWQRGRTGGGSCEEMGSDSEKLPEARLCPSAGLRNLRRFFSV